MLSDFLTFGFRSLAHRKIRSWLTIIGIFIGIAAVVSLISISQGMQQSITEQFQMMGSDKLMVTAGGGSIFGPTGGGFSMGEITDHDLDVIQRINEVKYVTGFIYKSIAVEFNKKTIYTVVMGLPLDSGSLDLIESMQSYHLENGRRLKQGDKYKAMIGYSLYHDDKLFGKNIGIGNTLAINDKEFRVIGSLQEIGNRFDDNQIYLPIDTAREIFDEPEKLDAILIQVKEGYNPSDVADKIKDAMRKDRDLKKGEEDFTVSTSEQLMAQIGTILGIIQMIFVGIAGISLLVGGVGIMNTMYTSVLERRKEIGIMKAIGAKNSDVLSIFLIESGSLGFVGGVIGVTLGIGMAKVVEIYASLAGFPMLKASITPQLILLGFGFAFLFGTLCGTLPARQASKLKPVDALRYE